MARRERESHASHERLAQPRTHTLLAPRPTAKARTALRHTWPVHSASHPSTRAAARATVAAGVCAALHVGKLAPAIPALQQSLGMSLVQAGFLLSAVQLAGMGLGMALGAAGDHLGAKRSMVLGLLVLALASAGGALAPTPAWLLLWRGVEGLGFLLVVLPGPGLLRALVAPEQLQRYLGFWSAYMPLATALALLGGPGVIALAGWRGWWWLAAALTLAMAAGLQLLLPAQRASAHVPWRARLRQTLAARGPWLAAACFALYAMQWLAVIGFLPLIYTQAGVSGAATAWLTASVAAINIVGNLAAGRLLQRGVAAATLLRCGYAGMALACVLAFTDIAAGAAWLRYLGVLAFSLVGGLIPATLFTLALRVAPSESTLASTLGWMQQGSALGQFVGPPLLAWLALASGGWPAMAWLSAAAALLALWLIPALARAARAR